MFKNLSLQTRLFSAFLFMGVLVLIVALVGWSGNSRLSQHISTLSNNSLPSVIGLWKVNEGQTQVQSSERSLINPRLSSEQRQLELSRLSEAWRQIDEGFKQYETTPRTPEEERQYQKLLQDWERWKHDHEAFMRLNQEFERLNILNPLLVQLQLLQKGQENSPQMAAAVTAGNLLDQLRNQAVEENLPSFEAATDSILALINVNEDFAETAKNSADKDVAQTTFWVLLGMIIGPLTAVIFGIFFSITIARPLGAKISNIVNSIVTSSTEIAATVEQQERTATQQAVAVSQTTTTMDELGASSRVTAEQAESAATGAKQVLTLVDGNGSTQMEFNGRTGSSLREKVGQIAEQILHLSEQTNQIGSISDLVSDLANQTNMLALNAAVEAVRAGDHGKGFAVVASEIRKLADQSRKSAEKINSLVRDIQNATNSTVMATDEGTKTVENIVAAVNHIAVNSQQISLTAKQQAVAIQQVVEAMNSLKFSASETASGISQTKQGVQRLNEAALNLKVVV